MSMLTANSSIGDDVLVARFQADQDREAFDELVRRHRNRVYSLALRMVKNEQEALEIVQDTFLQAFRKLAEFRGDSKFGSWIHRIAANYALMHLRRRRVIDQVEEPLEVENANGVFAQDGSWEVYPTGLWARRADDLALDAELREKIIEAVEKLPEMYRAVFMLRDLDGLTYGEIAEALETTIPAIKSRLHRARLALRADLSAYFEGKEA